MCEWIGTAPKPRSCAFSNHNFEVLHIVAITSQHFCHNLNKTKPTTIAEFNPSSKACCSKQPQWRTWIIWLQPGNSASSRCPDKRRKTEEVGLAPTALRWVWTAPKHTLTEISGAPKLLKNKNMDFALWKKHRWLGFEGTGCVPKVERIPTCRRKAQYTWQTRWRN